jgi:hydroxymethylglutaryl-CoA reductase
MNYHDFFYQQTPILLRGLKQDTPALWGQMNAQQMIEHLAFIVSVSNGRLPVQPTAESARLAHRKMRYFEKDTPIPKGLRVEMVPETPHPMAFPDIEAAKMHLFEQLDRFDDFFNEHPNLTTMHPMLGPLNYDEWVQTHARHFRHHLQQFGILPEE